MSVVVHLPEVFYTDNNIRYVFIDGHACGSFERCYSVLQQQLSIPGYFGNNLDALEEVLEDLDWIKQEKIKIIIANEDAVLMHQPVKRNVFFDVLHAAVNNKIEIIYLGKQTGPGAKPV